MVQLPDGNVPISSHILTAVNGCNTGFQIQVSLKCVLSCEQSCCVPCDFSSLSYLYFLSFNTHSPFNYHSSLTNKDLNAHLNDKFQSTRMMIHCWPWRVFVSPGPRELFGGCKAWWSIKEKCMSCIIKTTMTHSFGFPCRYYVHFEDSCTHMQPRRPTHAILHLSSKQTVGFSPTAWFLSIFLLFGNLFLIAALLIPSIMASYLSGFLTSQSPFFVVNLLSSWSRILNQAVFDICISLLKISPLGATALISYFFLVLVLIPVKSMETHWNGSFSLKSAPNDSK